VHHCWFFLLKSSSFKSESNCYFHKLGTPTCNHFHYYPCSLLKLDRRVENFQSIIQWGERLKSLLGKLENAGFFYHFWHLNKVLKRKAWGELTSLDLVYWCTIQVTSTKILIKTVIIIIINIITAYNCNYRLDHASSKQRFWCSLIPSACWCYMHLYVFSCSNAWGNWLLKHNFRI
jgi:hypothetical protein